MNKIILFLMLLPFGLEAQSWECFKVTSGSQQIADYATFIHIKTKDGATFRKKIKFVENNQEVDGAEEKIREFIQQSLFRKFRVCPIVGLIITHTQSGGGGWQTVFNMCVGRREQFPLSRIVSEVKFVIKHPNNSAEYVIITGGGLCSKSFCDGPANLNVDRECRTVIKPRDGTN